MSTLQVRNLSKSFRGRKVVRDVSLEVGSGEVIGLLGPNGAGKTTSFYMIIGLIPSDQGTILLDDGVISNLPIDRRARLGLGYLPQEASIFRRLKVAEKILAILQTRPELSETEALERLENLLREFNIEHIRTQPGMSLSGGERRRVEIARALATDPKFLLLDEPFAGIDPISIHDLQQTIRYLANRGLGVLVTDHNVRETLGACHRSYIVNEGQIIAEGSQEDILSHDEVRSVYLGERFKL
jgi:lipopolysaccharide export system ATP-binding protein